MVGAVIRRERVLGVSRLEFYTMLHGRICIGRAPVWSKFRPLDVGYLASRTTVEGIYFQTAQIVCQATARWDGEIGLQRQFALDSQDPTMSRESADTALGLAIECVRELLRIKEVSNRAI